MADNRTLPELIAAAVKAQRALAEKYSALGDSARAEEWRWMADRYTAKLEEMGQGHLLEDDK